MEMRQVSHDRALEVGHQIDELVRYDCSELLALGWDGIIPTCAEPNADGLAVSVLKDTRLRIALRERPSDAWMYARGLSCQDIVEGCERSTAALWRTASYRHLVLRRGSNEFAGLRS